MGASGVNAALAILKGEKVAEQTSVPTLLLSRTQPDAVKAFAESLK